MSRLTIFTSPELQNLEVALVLAAALDSYPVYPTRPSLPLLLEIREELVLRGLVVQICVQCGKQYTGPSPTPRSAHFTDCPVLQSAPDPSPPPPPSSP